MKLIIMVVSVIAMIGFNILATTLPLNGISTATISDMFPIFFVPTGYVFAIWGLIYITQLLFVFGLWRKQKDYKSLIDSVWGIFIFSQVMNILWLFLWHYQIFILTVPVMLLLLLSLCLIYVRIAKDNSLPSWILSCYGIYLGWITVATVANVSDVVSLYWSGSILLPQVWAALLIQVAVLLTVLIILRHKDFAYSAVIMWSIIGIAFKFPEEHSIVLSVIFGCFIIISAVTAVIFRSKRLPQDTK